MSAKTLCVSVRTSSLPNTPGPTFLMHSATPEEISWRNSVSCHIHLHGSYRLILVLLQLHEDRLPATSSPTAKTY